MILARQWCHGSCVGFSEKLHTRRRGRTRTLDLLRGHVVGILPHAKAEDFSCDRGRTVGSRFTGPASQEASPCSHRMPCGGFIASYPDARLAIAGGTTLSRPTDISGGSAFTTPDGRR